ETSLASAGTMQAISPDGYVPELSGRAGGAAMAAPADDDAGTDARSQLDVENVADSVAGTEGMLPERTEGGIVGDVDRNLAQLRAQLCADVQLGPGGNERLARDAAFVRDRKRHAQTDSQEW